MERGKKDNKEGRKRFERERNTWLNGDSLGKVTYAEERKEMEVKQRVALIERRNKPKTS